MSERFWETTSLAEMNDAQWEAVCDGCGRCCLIKLQDEEDDTVYYTDIACKLLDLSTCRCTRYAERQYLVGECIKLSKDRLGELWLMPPSCSYRRLAEGRGLPDWHHLLTGRPEAVLQSGFSLRDLAIRESDVPPDTDLEDRLVEWPVLDEPVIPGQPRS